jgi:hypothetical protein
MRHLEQIHTQREARIGELEGAIDRVRGLTLADGCPIELVMYAHGPIGVEAIDRCRI